MIATNVVSQFFSLFIFFSIRNYLSSRSVLMKMVSEIQVKPGNTCFRFLSVDARTDFALGERISTELRI